MFEIDENTKYSLRILGRGSLIVVSVAFILAIIGYFHQDGSNEEQSDKIPDVVFAEQFIQMAKSSGEKQIKDRIINIKGTVDSVKQREQETTAFLSGNSGEILEFKLNSDTKHIEKKQEIIFTGEYEGKTNGRFQFDNCTFKKQ